LFGYILPYKSELKVGEYEIYRAVYCGLCKQLGRVFGPFAKLTLSYDFAFLALFELSLKKDCPRFARRSCAANPLVKRNCLLSCDALDSGACSAMIMLYYKLKDDISDSGFVKRNASRALLPFAACLKNKGAKRLGHIDEIVREAMEGQTAIESAPNESATIDRAAHPTASAMGRICQSMAVYTDDADNQSQALYRFGYLIGRYVYLADALDDLAGDLKSGSFNPFAGVDRDLAVQTINLTICQIAEVYALIKIRRFSGIIENIIYLGLKDTVDKIQKGESRSWMPTRF